MSDDRCYACCQENCGRTRCYCDCHGRAHPKDTDCPKGIHEVELYRCRLGDPTSAEYWCRHCGVKTDAEGRALLVLLPQRKCKAHPRYQGKRKPRAVCEECFYIWEAGGFRK